MTTFGFELAVDSILAEVILGPHPALGQLNAGYLASIFGLLNIVTRPSGGLAADLLYARFGVHAKKYFCLFLGILQGAFTIAFGKFLQGSAHSDLTVMMVLIVFMAVTCGMGNGANFSLVPHCNVHNNGVMSVTFSDGAEIASTHYLYSYRTGIVGAFGNLGGIW